MKLRKMIKNSLTGLAVMTGVFSLAVTVQAENAQTHSVSQNTLQTEVTTETDGAAEILYSGTTGENDNISWSIDSEGLLTISGSGDYSLEVTSEEDFYETAWYDYREYIQSAVVEITDITSTASMFYQCSNLTSVDLSGLDTSNVTDMRAMFASCNSLTSLDVSDLDTGNVANMNMMFIGCSDLTSLDVSMFDTANVTEMEYMFAGCSSLTSLDISGFDTKNVTSMYSMFTGCTGLTSLNVSGLDTSNVGNMRFMFERCSSLTSLDVSGFDTGNVWDMACMFSNCSNLTSLDVSGFDTKNVTDMGSLFENCSSLTYIDVSGFNTTEMLAMYSMFSGCSNLVSIDMSSFDTSHIFYASNVQDVFDGCNKMTSIILPANLKLSVELPVVTGYHWKDANGVVRAEGVTGLSVPMAYTRHEGIAEPGTGTEDQPGNSGNGGAGTNNSGNTGNQNGNGSALPQGTVITDTKSAAKYEVVQPSSGSGASASQPAVEYVGTTNKKKKTISIPEYVTYQGVKYKVVSVKAKAFKGNKKLTSVKIASAITTIGASAFEGCTNLKSVTVGTSLRTIGKNAFKNCKKLTKISIKSMKLKSVGKNAFKGINAKCKIKVPKAKVKAYQKLMKNKGQKKSVKIVKI